MIVNIENSNGNTIGGIYVYENNENGEVIVKDIKGDIDIAGYNIDNLFDTNDEMIRIQLRANLDENLLKDIIKLKQLGTKENELWQFEDLMDNAAYEFYKDIKKLADKYQLNYNDRYEDFVEDDEYEAECIVLDRMAWNICWELEEYLKKETGLKW